LFPLPLSAVQWSPPLVVRAPLSTLLLSPPLPLLSAARCPRPRPAPWATPLELRLPPLRLLRPLLARPSPTAARPSLSPRFTSPRRHPTRPVPTLRRPSLSSLAQRPRPRLLPLPLVTPAPPTPFHLPLQLFQWALPPALGLSALQTRPSSLARLRPLTLRPWVLFSVPFLLSSLYRW
jgi:hypothetical protein